jgi:hypothetical protein
MHNIDCKMIHENQHAHRLQTESDKINMNTQKQANFLPTLIQENQHAQRLQTESDKINTNTQMHANCLPLLSPSNI